MTFYDHIKSKLTELSVIKFALNAYFEVKDVEIITLPEMEIVIAIKTINKVKEVFITIETNGLSEVYSEDQELEIVAKNFLTKLKRDFKIDQILAYKNK